tara:strand:+ start:633 stop:1211 length:579 start_codon:yes stop_codon:yes gene_type:complete
MNTLDQISFDNLEILLKLNRDDIISCSGKKLVNHENKEFVSINSISDIEYSLYFTFMRLLHLREYEYLDRKDLFNNIDDAIDNIYENKDLNKLIDENEDLKEIIEDIDQIYEIYSNEITYDIYDNFFNYIKSKFELLKGGFEFYYIQYLKLKEEKNNKKILNNEIIKFIENKSALIIQKYVRGMISRKNINQ